LQETSLLNQRFSLICLHPAVNENISHYPALINGDARVKGELIDINYQQCISELYHNIQAQGQVIGGAISFCDPLNGN